MSSEFTLYGGEMSEKLIRFLLKELKKVRVICRHAGCGGIVEIPIEELPAKFPEQKCPFCKKDMQNHDVQHDGFRLLSRAVQELTSRPEQMEIEFELPDKG